MPKIDRNGHIKLRQGNKGVFVVLAIRARTDANHSLQK